MGFLGKMKELVGIEEIDDDEFDEPKAQKVAVPEKKLPERATPDRKAPERKAPERKAPERPFPDRKPPERTSFEDPLKAAEQRRATMQPRGFTNQYEMFYQRPTDFDECPKYVDSLRARKPVIINLEDLQTEMARKIFDFMSGATYALGGTVQKVTNNVFIFAPTNVDIKFFDNQKNPNATDSMKSPWS